MSGECGNDDRQTTNFWCSSWRAKSATRVTSERKSEREIKFELNSNRKWIDDEGAARAQPQDTQQE
jgi:hypothetical protein